MSTLSAEESAIVESEQRLLDAFMEAVQSSPDAHRLDLRAPYFAHLQISTANRRRDLLLGFGSFIDPDRKVTMLDWRNAPLAAVFFNYKQGEAYEEELEDQDRRRVIRGRVERKALLEFDHGELVRISTPERTLSRDRGEQWQVEPAETLPQLDGGSEGLPRRQVVTDDAGRKIPVVSGLLDQEQRAVLARDPRRHLLILGGAGCGKTTVALHRLARLHQDDPGRYGRRGMAVVVPEPGLARLCTLILGELGLERIGVFTYDDWITRQARKVFRDLPRRLCHDVPGRVVKLKRHPALRAVLPALVDQITEEIAQALDRRLAGRGALQQQLLSTPGATLLERLDRCEEQTLEESPERLHHGIKQAFSEQRRRLFSVHEDLLYLFGDRTLLGRVMEASGGELGPAAVADVLEHTRIQFSETSEEAFAHVDADRRQTVDGRSLDAGTPQEAAGTVDVEDLAVCFELLRLKTGGLKSRAGGLSRYAHLVIDEAQDLAPIELAVLGRALRRTGSVTISGDQAQQIDPKACFTDWERALSVLEVEVEGSEPVHLRTSYRCPAPVTRFAHQVLGSLAPDEMPRAAQDGPPVLCSSFPTEAHAGYQLVRALANLVDREPAATVAVITRSPQNAERIHQVLERSIPVRLVRAGEFSFTPGIDVTDVAQVKGLEFDVVIVPDATPASYPDDPDSRRKLHVACTRPICQLWVLSVGRPSPILPPF